MYRIYLAFVSLFVLLYLFGCDEANPDKKVYNLVVIKVTDANEHGQEYIAKFDTIRFSIDNYLQSVEFSEDDASSNNIKLTLRKGYSFSISPLTTLGEVQENGARIRLQTKYNFNESETGTEIIPKSNAPVIQTPNQ